MNTSDADIDRLLKRLHLAFLRRHWTDLVERAEKEQWSYRDFFVVAVREEIAHRVQTGIGRRTRDAKFPFLKTIEEFNFKLQSDLRQVLLGSFLGPEFVASGQSLILQGKPGRGKTHLAVSIAYKAILNGHNSLFTTAAELIEDLASASEAGRLSVALKRYVAPDVLVIDEVGYLTLSDNAANVLYHVVNRRYLRHKPMIFTTNKPLTMWGRVLHDNDLAEAILDRVLHHGRLIILDGPSVRSPTILQSTTETAIVSGKRSPEFSEPTEMRAKTGAGLGTQSLR